MGYSVDFVLRPEVNKSFARAEPLWMDRYTRLAVANIERSPSAFVIASLRRVLRMFFVLGSDDRFRAAQFEGSSYVYAAATCSLRLTPCCSWQASSSPGAAGIH